MASKHFKECIKYILLAQVASDAGKGYVSAKSNNARKALAKKYAVKDKYITQAIAAARRTTLVRVSYGVDFGLGMDIIYFDIRGFGQVSFHSYKEWWYLNLPEGRWNGIAGGSVDTCKKLARKLNLPYYKTK